MMQSCASRRSPGRRAHSSERFGKPWGAAGPPPPRIVIGSLAQGCQSGCPVIPLPPRCCSGRRTQDDALRHLARRNEMPERDEQLARQRHDHRLARAAASVGRSRREPLGQGAVLLKPEKTPSQLDHATPNARIAGTRKTSLAPAAAALVRRAGKASIAGDRPAIAQVPREELVDQHVGRLDADTAEARSEANHRVRAFISCRGRRELAQAFVLNRADLLAHDA